MVQDAFIVSLMLSCFLVVVLLPRFSILSSLLFLFIELMWQIHINLVMTLFLFNYMYLHCLKNKQFDASIPVI